MGCLDCGYFLVLVFGKDEGLGCLCEGLGSGQEGLSRLGFLLDHAEGQGLVQSVGLLLLQ